MLLDYINADTLSARYASKPLFLGAFLFLSFGSIQSNIQTRQPLPGKSDCLIAGPITKKISWKFWWRNAADERLLCPAMTGA